MADYIPQETPAQPEILGSADSPAPSPISEPNPLTLSEKIAKNAEKIQKTAPASPEPSSKDTLATKATGPDPKSEKTEPTKAPSGDPATPTPAGEPLPAAAFAPDFKFKFTDEKAKKWRPISLTFSRLP